MGEIISKWDLLLKKYNKPGPRYTSYPTVPAWTEEVGPIEYVHSLAQLKPEEKLSLYFHIPFCEKLCHFCGCMQVITQDHDRSSAYVATLLKEIDTVLQYLPSQVREVCQLHFGGGTPNFLKPEEMEVILKRLRENFIFSENAEIAIEMHPRTSTIEFCQMLKHLDFNRISLGIQDFDPRVQKLINRHQTYEMTAEMIDQLRVLDFHSFNFDLIYGLPGQSLETWQDTLQKVIALKPNRLAVYSYAHVPWIRPVQRSFADSDLPSPELKLKLFQEAYLAFTSQGYRSIGMDHFALEGDELAVALDQGSLHRNFMGYSTQADAHQIGFGVSSISYVGGNYFQNQKDLPLYEHQIQDGQLASFRGFLLSQDDAIRRDLITQIMCLGRVGIPQLEEKWKINFKEYFSSELDRMEELVSDGLVLVEDDKLEASSLGQLFLRILAMVFDPYLTPIQNQSKNPTFSKTV